MLYLAEIQKQSKGFMGGVETKLKLIACQRNDQSWSLVSNEFVTTDQADNFGDGALVILDLGVNRQIQGSIESASQKIISVLKNFSRLLEKTKNQEQEIDQWKESLTIQSEELSRQKIEMETRFEQVEQMEEEFKQFEQQKEEITAAKIEAENIKAEFEVKSAELQGAWEQLRGQQENLAQQLKESSVLDQSQAADIREKLQVLASAENTNKLLKEKLDLAVNTLDSHHKFLQPHWQKFHHYSESIQDQLQALENKTTELSHKNEQIYSLEIDIVKTQQELEVQQKSLEVKQELKDFLNLQLTEQKSMLELLEGSRADSNGIPKADLNKLENMPLPNLETIVENLKQDLEKVARFVNDQEEELGWQCKTVEELEEKISRVNEFERFTLEQELADELEAKKMLDQTLVGQRRSLKERHQILLQHSRVLKRRQGIIDFDFDSEIQDIDLTPIKQGLEEQQTQLVQQQEKLAQDIVDIEECIKNYRKKLEQQKSQKNEWEADIVQKQNDWNEANFNVIKLQSCIDFYDQQLQPLQDNLDLITNQINEINQTLEQHNEKNHCNVINEIEDIIEELVIS